VSLSRLCGWWDKKRWNSLYSQYRKRYDIDPSFDFRDSVGVVLGGTGRIKLGPESYIQSYSVLRADGNTSLTVGKRVAIAEFVRVFTCQQKVDQRHVGHDAVLEYADVVVGDDCWLCRGVVVTPGCHIGDGMVVGANAVVTHDLPRDVLAGGVPAKVIRRKKV